MLLKWVEKGYKYFNSIDLVFSTLIDKAKLQGNHLEQIDEIIKSDKAPEIILRDLFLVAEEYFSEMLISYNKILFLCWYAYPYSAVFYFKFHNSIIVLTNSDNGLGFSRNIANLLFNIKGEWMMKR